MGQSLTGGGSGRVGRQVFIGQRPTGLGLDPNTGQPSAQQPFYTQSDVLVDSTEQPNLYTYNINPATGVGQFDPMVTTTTVNPFDTPATPLSTSYTAPTTTPDFTSDVDFAEIFETNVVTPDQVRAFYRMYLGRDPGVNQYVMQFVNSGKTIDQIETEIMNSPEAQNFSITGTPVSSAEELAQITAERNAVTPEKVRGFYQQYLGRDPGNNEFVMGWVNSGMSLADVEAQIAASQEAQNFAGTAIAAGTPPPADTTADTTQTVADTSNITGATTNITDTTANEDGVPVGDTGLTSTQAAILAIEQRKAEEEAAAAAAAAQSPANTFTNILGTVQNPSSVKKEEDPPRMSFEDIYKTGFATGGIVGLTDGMSLEANSGQGLESFLRSRSKAALRRNLAKVAPRPTMQAGIMPMAR
jgi:cell pole-organizing protein PopZ